MCVCVLLFIVALLLQTRYARDSFTGAVMFLMFLSFCGRARAVRWNKWNRPKMKKKKQFYIRVPQWRCTVFVCTFDSIRFYIDFGSSKRILCAVWKIYFDFNWIIISCALSSLIIFTHSDAWKLYVLFGYAGAMHCVYLAWKQKTKKKLFEHSCNRLQSTEIGFFG